jgi:hypothetical protein
MALTCRSCTFETLSSAAGGLLSSQFFSENFMRYAFTLVLPPRRKQPTHPQITLQRREEPERRSSEGTFSSFFPSSLRSPRAEWCCNSVAQ